MSKPIASRIVPRELQERFAALSGDRNPIHMDEAAARRTQAGAPVVHGVHTLLWALESLVAAGILISPIARIRARFLAWVYVGDEASLISLSGDSVDPTAVQVEVLGKPVMTLEISYGQGAQGAPAGAEHPTPPSPPAPIFAPRERSIAELHDGAGVAFTASRAAARNLFPVLSDFLSGTVVAEIAACSYLVGMEVPGLYSLLSRLDLGVSSILAERTTATALSYRVGRVDERFRKARISVTASMVEGTIDVFVRPPPVEQPPMKAVARLVHPNEFAGMRALVVGGSRGLGSLTAKLIAAGGGHATITYAVGIREAQNVLNDIRESGGTAEILQYDVRRPPEPQLARLNSPVTYMLYFATNAIFRSAGAIVSPLVLADFVAYYLQGFHDICVALLKKGQSDGACPPTLTAYYPSSVAIDERPRGMTEYSMIKAAGEQMCRDMTQHIPGLRILVTRLPRLRTDQTASVIPERDTDPASVLLPVLREMQTLDGRR